MVKEIKYRPKISQHDFDFKTNHIKEFLEAGNKVKVTIMFRGREMAHQSLGLNLLNRVKHEVDEMAKVELEPKLEGRQMIMVLAPR